MDITDPEERCLSHARIAARQAVMKGLDPETVADAFMLEAIKLTFGLDDPEAARGWYSAGKNRPSGFSMPTT